MNSILQNQIIDNQQQVINAPTELWAGNREQLESVKKNLESSVVNSVKAKFQTDSSIVQNSEPTRRIINPNTLKEVVNCEKRCRRKRSLP